MVMIRRELPRTKRAGWVRKPFRIEDEEGSPFRGPCAVIGSAVLSNTPNSFLGGFGESVLLFGFDGDGPNESQ